MNFPTRLISSATIVLILGACSSYPTPQTEVISEAIDLSRFDTFSVRVHGEAQDTAFGPQWRDKVFKELVDEFEDVGYRYRNAGDADFNVVFTTVVSDKDVLFTTDYSQPERHVIVREKQTSTPGGDIVITDRETEIVSTYKSTPISVASMHRLIVIDVVDADTKVLLWRGYVESDDTELEKPERMEEHIERIVDKLPRS